MQSTCYQDDALLINLGLPKSSWLFDRFYMHMVQHVGFLESYPRLYWCNYYNNTLCTGSVCFLIVRVLEWLRLERNLRDHLL